MVDHEIDTHTPLERALAELGDAIDEVRYTKDEVTSAEEWLETCRERVRELMCDNTKGE